MKLVDLNVSSSGDNNPPFKATVVFLQEESEPSKPSIRPRPKAVRLTFHNTSETLEDLLEWLNLLQTVLLDENTILEKDDLY